MVSKIDDILGEYIGRIKTYEQVHRGLPEHVTGDKAHALAVAKASLKSALLECVPEEDNEMQGAGDSQDHDIIHAVGFEKGFNLARQQVLDNINQLFEGDV